MTEFRLDEVCSSVIDCEHKTVPEDLHGAAWAVGTAAMSDGRIDFSRAKRISDETYELWTRRAVPGEGDLILAREAPVGPVVRVPASPRVALGQRTVLLRPRQDVIDSRYLHFLLISSEMQHLMHSMSEGSTVRHLNVEDVRALPLPRLPPLLEQRAIVDVLGALDDKIESNNCLADLLIQLARTILETGENEVRLGDIATCDKGLSYKGDGLQEDPSVGLPMVNLANFGVNGWLNSEKLKYYSGEYKERHILKAGDLVVANTDLTQLRIIIGRPALVPPSLGKAIFTHHVTAIRPLNDEKLRLPIWAQLNSPAFRERAEGFATGTTVAGMPVEALLDFNVRIPDEGIISDAQELLERVWVAESESRSLKNAKEMLMPELLSGRMRVKDAESMMEIV